MLFAVLCREAIGGARVGKYQGSCSSIRCVNGTIDWGKTLQLISVIMLGRGPLNATLLIPRGEEGRECSSYLPSLHRSEQDSKIYPL